MEKRNPYRLAEAEPTHFHSAKAILNIKEEMEMEGYIFTDVTKRNEHVRSNQWGAHGLKHTCTGAHHQQCWELKQTLSECTP